MPFPLFEEGFSGAFSGRYTWEVRIVQQQLPHPLAIEDCDFAPDDFQNWLLDLANLSTIYGVVGNSMKPEHSPVSNWLRLQGIKVLYDAESNEFQVWTLEGAYLGRPPAYLVRYLWLLHDDIFPGVGEEYDVPAYQALALLSYVLTTERYLDQTASA